jgi:hypothetical protein
MTPAPKAKRSPKNQPPVFKEAAVMPVSAPALPTIRAASAASKTRLSDAQIRLLMFALWGMFSIAAGIAIGRLIIDAQTPVSTSSPVPVAKAALTVKSATSAQLAAPQVTVQSALATSTGTEIRQATSGSPQATAGTGQYQLTGHADYLQPGFTHFGRAQGTLGTAPSSR